MDGVPDGTRPSPLPLACTLGPDDGRSRLLRWQRLNRIATHAAHFDDGQLEVRYQPGPGVQEELAALAAAEQECCSFAVWSVSVVGGQPVLNVRAPTGAPDAVAPIAALFGATSSATESQ